jgi:hypothetical protein
MITQAELESFLESKRFATEAEAIVKGLNADFMAREGEPVEPGLLALKIVTKKELRFSYLAIVVAMGKDLADALKSKMPLSTSRYPQVGLAK